MIVRVVQDYLEAYRSKQPDVVGGYYSEEAFLWDLSAPLYIEGSAGAVRGRKDIIEYYRGRFKAIPHRPQPAARTMVVQRHTGVLETVEEGRKFCHVFEVRGSLIVAHRIYWGQMPSGWVANKLAR